MRSATNVAGRALRHAAAERLGDERFIADRLVAFLSAKTGRSAAINNLRRFSFGFSWITYGFDVADDAGPLRGLVLRLGPSNGLFAPYRVGPQALSAAALVGTGIPVPAVLWSSDDPAAFGAPFLIAERATGSGVDPWSLVVTDGDPRRLAEHFVDILARLHAIDPSSTPLAALDGGARTGEAAARAQLDLWRDWIEGAQLRPHALLVAADLWFRRNLPAPKKLAIVHGDYRTGNFLEERGTISAVLDWELTHLGDPVEDLGWALLPMYNGGRKALLGVMEEQEALDRYEAGGGVPVGARHLAFYKAFALYKSAAIEILAARRFEDGGVTDIRLAGMGAQLPGLLRQLDRALERATAA